MPGGRTPGALSQEDRPVDVRDGTSPRLATPTPGTLRASPEEVARWPLERKLLVAAERAADYLPGEMREQFLLLFTPECLAITAGVMLVWAGSHYVGIGFVADVLMLLVALGTLGWQAIQVG
ncbi:MAG: hypothetical protein K2X91_04575, partial [Thermoleophilia bacterium]|nr:hypothetical protein [Thermoleophilia bacterium]